MDEGERYRIDTVLDRARRQGITPRRALDDARLLMTTEVVNRARADILLEVADDLENATIGDLIRITGGNPSSALDAQRAIVEYLRVKGRRYQA